jgi:hypothetical protein
MSADIRLAGEAAVSAAYAMSIRICGGFEVICLRSGTRIGVASSLIRLHVTRIEIPGTDLMTMMNLVLPSCIFSTALYV